jgi:hypothetical protein
MIIVGGAKRRWAVGTNLGVLCIAMLTMTGCGSDGKATATFPTPVPAEALVTGVVRLPNGVLASARSPWTLAARFGLLASAHAASVENPSVFPAGGVQVTLSRVDHADAADGVIGDNPGNAPLILGQSLNSDEEGNYTINKTKQVLSVDGCGFMVAVGDLRHATLTRAFVLAASPAATDIDVVSETVVRVILDRLTKAPPVQLCEFALGSPGLQAVTDAVSNAVFTATGSTVEEINQSAFEKAMANADVQAAVDEASGVPVAD